ncbi:hypothetical protein ACFVJ3_30735 [Rhodococcus sp. NPDC127593]|uniref:hypothetical protein n=2 Tax=unclassified Rhodococcus (in: high G+C Gram-positive bacteria) TaxID=192944 RepID=UPI00362D926C
MHAHPLIQTLMFVGLVGAALPLFWGQCRTLEVWVAHLAMVVVMATMFIPGGSAGWVSVVAGCVLLALAMWVTSDIADRSTALPCAADLTAMSLILVFVSPAMASADAVPRSDDDYQTSFHDHHVAGGATTITSWLGPLVLMCWAGIVLFPLFARRREPTGRHANITAASGILMLTGMVPMAA